MNYKKVLTVFAHPDDETLAAGGTIKKLTDEGIEVHVAIPATGVYARRNVQTKDTMNQQLDELRGNCEDAMRLLGVSPDNIYFGDFPDNEMDSRTLLELIQWIESIIDQVKPDMILTHHIFCTNIDHQYCHGAVVVATRPTTKSHIDVICGEVPSSTGYLKPTQWEPNLFVGLSENDINTKIKAMETFEGEARPDPHPRSGEVLKALAKVRGAEAGEYYAEAFMIHRRHW